MSSAPHPDKEAPYARAKLLLQQGAIDEAIAVLKSLVVQVRSPQTFARLAAALVQANRHDDAVEVALDAIQSNPLSWDVHDALGRVMVAIGDFSSAVYAFRASAVLRCNPRVKPEKWTIPVHYIVHILEQLDYIERRSASRPSLLDRLPRQHRATFHAQMSAMIAGAASEIPFVSVSGADGDALMNLPLLAPKDETTTDLLNRQIDFAAMETRFLSQKTKVIVIDDFLSAEALGTLRHFCLGVTAWRRPYKFGYVGAFPEDGFASLGLFGIAEALKAAMPMVLGQHRLQQWWAFAYDPRLPGTDIHGDDSDISLNLWITPSEANLEPSRGGLVVWDKAAPSDWSFNEYNSGGEKVRSWLQQSQAKEHIIPHAANRAILFEGRLFHCSDGTHFAPGFENRRRNVTFLFRKTR